MDKEQAVGEDYHHHMQIPWQDFVEDDNVTPAKEAPLVERSMIVGRVGLMILACGTGSWPILAWYRLNTPALMITTVTPRRSRYRRPG